MGAAELFVYYLFPYEHAAYDAKSLREERTMFRTVSLVFLTLIAALALLFTPASAARQFPETGFSVSNDKFLDFFDHRGGARALGFPISREFDFLGTRVQFFQRAALQLQPNGSVATLNLLDEGLLPYTHINGSTFPAPNPAITQTAPSPADPNFASKALDFVKANAPDSWEGLKTNFYSTFLGTVTYQEAFPKADADPALLPLINLELWGLPISKPAYDPNNGNFVYLRFQRGIMHFDKTNGTTQGILIGDYLKSVLTGQNLPPDLAQDAQASKLYRQYDNNNINGVARSSDLPATNLFAAFEKDGVVVPTPAPSPTPVPATPTPATTATPVPTTAPAAHPRPDVVQITGSPWFTEQTKEALKLLPASVRDYVHKIVEAQGSSSIDIQNRTLYVVEGDAFPWSWRGYQTNQIQWYAGLIVHAATHIEQYYGGRPYQGTEAEREAQLRQKATFITIDSTPGQQFVNYLSNALAKGDTSVADWAVPPDPR